MEIPPNNITDISTRIRTRNRKTEDSPYFPREGSGAEIDSVAFRGRQLLGLGVEEVLFKHAFGVDLYYTKSPESAPESPNYQGYLHNGPCLTISRETNGLILLQLLKAAGEATIKWYKTSQTEVTLRLKGNCSIVGPAAEFDPSLDLLHPNRYNSDLESNSWDLTSPKS